MEIMGEVEVLKKRLYEVHASQDLMVEGLNGKVKGLVESMKNTSESGVFESPARPQSNSLTRLSTPGSQNNF